MTARTVSVNMQILYLKILRFGNHSRARWYWFLFRENFALLLNHFVTETFHGGTNVRTYAGVTFRCHPHPGPVLPHLVAVFKPNHRTDEKPRHGLSGDDRSARDIGNWVV